MDKKKILIVDDDKNCCLSLEILFQGRGFDVDLLLDGKEAIDVISKGRNYQFVFFDLNMPGMTGVEFFKELKKICPQAVAVMITGYGTMEKNMALQMGINEYLVKPFGNDEVLKIIEKYSRGGINNGQKKKDTTG